MVQLSEAQVIEGDLRATLKWHNSVIKCIDFMQSEDNEFKWNFDSNDFLMRPKVFMKEYKDLIRDLLILFAKWQPGLESVLKMKMDSDKMFSIEDKEKWTKNP